MKYRMGMAKGHGAGDAVCFLSACREFARRTGNTAFVSELPNVVEAYDDPEHLRFGTEGMAFGVDCPESVHRLHEPGDYGNYYGTFLASMGVHPGGLPKLDLPVFPKGPSYAVVQPFSVFAKNPPSDYVQRIVSVFKELTGWEVFAIGRKDTCESLREVNYGLLSDDITVLMGIIQNASVVMTPRSLSAHLAAGYGKPTFVWAPGDGENWHLNYPDWPKEVVEFDGSIEESFSKLASVVSKAGGESVSGSESRPRRDCVCLSEGKALVEPVDLYPDPLEHMDRFEVVPREPRYLPVTSVVVETRPEMMGRLRRITEWHRKFFRFHREIVVSDRDPQMPGVTFVNCGTPPLRHPKEGLLVWYSDMCIKWLDRLCDTRFLLVWQWDGFILEPDNFSNDFFDWDYLGAPLESVDLITRMVFMEKHGWKRSCGVPVVGNGGFSLRSKKFLEASAALSAEGFSRAIEDLYLCVERRADMEKAGVRFAPLNVARRFAGENKVGKSFGFHGFWMFEEVKRALEAKYLKEGGHGKKERA